MNSRRWFLCQVSATGAAALMADAHATVPPYPALQETEPYAQEVGYVEDVARVDRRKYPKYRPGQDCFGCDLYLAPRTEPWAPCTLFPRRVVAGKGWCDAYRPRRP